MEQLNEDCLLIIFKQLCNKDQIAVACASPRFEKILTPIWQREFKNFSDTKFENILYKELSVLLKCISPTVEQMEFSDLTFERYEMLKLNRYPKVKDFKFHCYSYNFKDKHILEMVKIFPSLQSFKPDGAFSGMHMEKMRHLQHLSLTFCEKKSFPCLQAIFERSHLKSIELDVYRTSHKWTSRRAFKNFCTLESIVLNSCELNWLRDIKQFKNLKQITITDHDRIEPFKEFLLNMHAFKSDDIIELETSVLFPYCYSVPVDVFGNLTKLVICYQNMLLSSDIGESAPNLKEIMFQECHIWTKDVLLYWLFRYPNHKSLEYMSVGDCTCAFENFDLDVKNVVKDRTEKLRFNFCGNNSKYLDEELALPFSLDYDPIPLNVQGSSPLLEVTSDDNYYSLATLRVVFK